jgi:hypothetical protein
LSLSIYPSVDRPLSPPLRAQPAGLWAPTKGCPSVNGREKLGETDAEPLCDLAQCLDARIPQPRFNAGDVGAIEARVIRQDLLGPSSLVAKLAHPRSQGSYQSIWACCHATW